MFTKGTYMMQSGRAGFYAYAIYERLERRPELHIDQTRLALKLREDKFQFMAVSDDRQRFMPTAEDRDRDHAQTLAYHEAVLLTNPSNRGFKGEVDDKYQYSNDVKDIKVHGWISTDDAIGLWMITPSTEFRSKGPFKQELTSHVGPTALIVFLSGHYVGKDVGLAASGDAGSWQTECKGYQYWTQADNQGYFYMKDVRPGNYSLYATVPGFIGDYKYEYDITIEPASTFEPPRNGPTLWEISIPNRSATEFNIPDPYPSLVNRLFTDNSANKHRQYGLWERYEDYYPNPDLIYTIGTNNYSDDWFYAHVTRNINGTYEATTWQIVFQLENVWSTRNYTLQLASASATYAELQVRFNNQNDTPHFSTGLTGRDNAIARHGIHGLYWLFSVDVPSYRLQQGYNTIYLAQSRNRGPFAGLMYDYIRLEGPPPK